MNNDRFDNFTRELANGLSRRDVLKLLGVIIGNSLLGFLGIKEASAKTLLTCPACGSCQEYSIDNINRTYTCAPCNVPCTAATLCNQAIGDSGYLLLENYLREHGFVSAGDTQALTLNIDGELEGSIIGTSYTKDMDRSFAPSISAHKKSNVRGDQADQKKLFLPLVQKNHNALVETALLLYKVNAIGETDKFAFVFENEVPSYILIINADGIVEKIFPTNEGNGLSPSLITTLNTVSLQSNLECTVICNVLCNVTTAVLCRLLVGLICSPAGLAAPLCFSVFQWQVCYPLDLIICMEICDSRCQEGCGGQCPPCFSCPVNGTRCEEIDCGDPCKRCNPDTNRCEPIQCNECISSQNGLIVSQSTPCCDPPSDTCIGPFGGCCAPDLCCHLRDSVGRDIGVGCCPWADGLCIDNFCCPPGSVALCTYTDPQSGQTLYACALEGRSCCGSNQCIDGLDTCCGEVCCRHTQGGVCCGTSDCCYPPFTCVDGRCIIEN